MVKPILKKVSGVLGLTIAAVLLVPSISAVASSPVRIAGASRYETAVEIAKNFSFSSTVPVVYIATGLNYPDALSAAPAAAFLGGPLLLTMPDELPESVRAEIVQLSPSLIVVAGGTSAVSATVFAQLEALAPEIRRDSGADRYETSRIINERAFTDGASSAFVATGRNFPDALSASAAAGSTDSPVILVDGLGTSVDGAALDLLASLGTTSIRIAGGTGVVSPEIESQLASNFVSVERLAGNDRYATSVAINTASFSSESKVYLATGTGFADALAGAALAGFESAPLYVVPSTCVPHATLNSMANLGMTTHVLLGGLGALDDGVSNLTDCESAVPPPPPPTYPAGNPGNTKNCPDFATWPEAQAWFLNYYPSYGDVALLDADNDMLACESLPGFPY